jgi:hypothetical protein
MQGGDAFVHAFDAGEVVAQVALVFPAHERLAGEIGFVERLGVLGRSGRAMPRVCSGVMRFMFSPGGAVLPLLDGGLLKSGVRSTKRS